MSRSHRGVRATLLALALALLIPAAAQAGYTPTHGSDFASPLSVWNKKLSATAPLSSKSSTYVGTLRDAVATSGSYINARQYSVPITTVPLTQPLVRMQSDQNHVGFQSMIDLVPIPADARPAPGTDGHLVVWQPATKTMWEFWRASKDANGVWHAKWGGRVTGLDTTLGFFSGCCYGATATGLHLTGGLMTIQEQADGVINHALALAIPNPSTSYVFPAQRTDEAGNSTAPDAIPAGTRFRLPASLNIEALKLNRQAKMMAYAAQKYGMIVRDRAGTVAFFGEDPQEYARANGFDPYAYLFGTASPSDRGLLAQFPWSKLQVVRP
jgi:hypothetical protein